MFVALAASAGALVFVACDDSSSGSAPVPAESGVPTPTTTPTSTTPPGPDSSTPDATVDSGANEVIGCNRLLKDNPALTSGVQAIDVDGPGPLPPLDVHCDMTFGGGGWTLIQSYDGASTPADLPLGGPDDAGVLGASPRPGTFGALAGWVVKLLAERSTQVHIRWSFQNDAGAADPTSGVWITSRPTSLDAPSQVIKNLRDLVVLTNGSDGGFSDWTGPQATALKLEWYPAVAGCGGLVPNEPYPSVFWACGNYESMNVIRTQGGHARWRWNNGGDRDPIEVYVR